MYKSVAGQFFPSDKAEQEIALARFFAEAQDFSLHGQLKGLIVPHAGWMYSGVVAASAYKLLKSRDPEPERVVLLGPGHWEPFAGIQDGILDHSVEVQLPFLAKILPHTPVISLIYGTISPGLLADEVEKRCGSDSVIIASSDLSHYYTYEVAKKIDRAAEELIPALNLERVANDVEACGKPGILALLILARRHGWKGTLLDYRNSGDTSGVKDSVVGYGSFALYAP
jgi:predicted class III extradiol MEMO1 family dioxygenase